MAIRQIVTTKGMSSEGVGSYWPFATGRRVDQANILLHQILDTPDTMFVLIPNQHVGCWETGFAPQWIAREFLARRGSNPFQPEKLVDARCGILGRTLDTIQIEGQTIGHWFLKVHTQPEVGEEAYDRGADILLDFFHDQIGKFKHEDLDPPRPEDHRGLPGRCEGIGLRRTIRRRWVAARAGQTFKTQHHRQFGGGVLFAELAVDVANTGMAIHARCLS